MIGENVTGYTIKQIEDVLYKTSTLEIKKLLNVNNKVILIFEYIFTNLINSMSNIFKFYIIIIIFFIFTSCIKENFLQNAINI